SFLLLVFLAAAGCNKSSAPTSSTDANPSSASAPAPDNSSASGPAASNNTSAAPASSNRARNESKPEPAKPLVVPSGTVITVRLGQSVGSKMSQPGQSFSATVATPVQVDGTTVIPSGANATGTVVDAKPLGRFKGGAALQLRLDSINING